MRDDRHMNAYRVVIVTLDRHAAGPAARVTPRLQADFPGITVDIFAAAEWGNNPAAFAECEAALRKVVDPEAADKLAKSDQAARIAAVGGKEAILKRGTFRYSPPPGVKPSYY